MILLASSLIIDCYPAFEYAQARMRKILPNTIIEDEFELVRGRTDPEMRKLFELCLHATIVTCNEELCLETLRYARLNTFLMIVQQNWLSTALSYFPSYL
jgi:hypothetical protein